MKSEGAIKDFENQVVEAMGLAFKDRSVLLNDAPEKIEGLPFVGE